MILDILSLLLFWAWACSEKTEQSKKESVGAAETVEEKITDTFETVQAGMVKAAEVAKEKAKKVIEELKERTQGSTEDTKKSK